MAIIFLDANILFSGSNPDSNLHRFLLYLIDRHSLVSSPYAIHEAERNILAKRPQWQDSHVDLLKKVKTVPDKVLAVDAGLPDKDKPILGAAIAAKCHYLLTGDKRDFGHLYGRQIEGVTVIDSLSLAALLVDQEV